ncbi:MAG: GNAT family N-acetyltransferase [Bacteroidales bacterium]|nr:GNAT family N-acetyltransferase [Bacteroidales bacterium]
MNLNIRKGMPSDAKVIAAFQILMAKETENITLDEPTVNKGVKAVFEKPDLGQYFVAEMDGKIVASLMTTFEWSDWRNSTVWWLQSVYVLPEYRQKGIFKKMYNFVKEQVLSLEEVSGIRLYMVQSNHRAAKVYENVGMDGERYRMFEWMKDY